MQRTPITTYRFFFKPTNGFEYPRYFDAFNKCLTSVWNPLEVDMSVDLIDWDKASAAEKEIIAGILRGFTQIETVIGDYWSNVVAKIFPKPEVVVMCYAFSFFEGLHAFGYNHLSSTLGLDEYSAYYSDPTAQEKIEYLLFNQSSPKVKLAVFSGCAEGVALFSSFSILLSFAKEGKFKGLSQIISWSIIDEQNHSIEGGELFKELVKLEQLTEDEKEKIKAGFFAVLENEIKFINRAFGEFESINGIEKSSFIDFIYERANERARNLELGDLIYFEYNAENARKVSEWFYPLAEGNISNDFFTHSKEGSLYVAKPTLDRSQINWEELSKIY